ncbi:MAG TPA: hypothetical protein V6D29_23135 [Leptolyngbyaceae cyanobacterium]
MFRRASLLAAPFLIAVAVPAAIAKQPMNVPGPCWMVNEQGRMVDLINMCGGYGATSSGASDATAPASSAAPGVDTQNSPGFEGVGFQTAPPESSVQSSTGSSEGVCNVPSDIASDGSRCGGRAASVRSGGR